MKNLTVKGPIDRNTVEFVKGIVNDLSGHPWVKAAVKAGLKDDPDSAVDCAALILKAMQMRVDETGDES